MIIHCLFLQLFMGIFMSCLQMFESKIWCVFLFPAVPGEQLRMCPQGQTCCTSSMEERLANLSAKETEGQIRKAGRSLQTTLNTLRTSFRCEFALYFVSQCIVTQKSDICMLCFSKVGFFSPCFSSKLCSNSRQQMSVSVNKGVVCVLRDKGTPDRVL